MVVCSSLSGRGRCAPVGRLTLGSVALAAVCFTAGAASAATAFDAAFDSTGSLNLNPIAGFDVESEDGGGLFRAEALGDAFGEIRTDDGPLARMFTLAVNIETDDRALLLQDWEYSVRGLLANTGAGSPVTTWAAGARLLDERSGVLLASTPITGSLIGNGIAELDAAGRAEEPFVLAPNGSYRFETVVSIVRDPILDTGDVGGVLVELGGAFLDADAGEDGPGFTGEGLSLALRYRELPTPGAAALAALAGLSLTRRRR